MPPPPPQPPQDLRLGDSGSGSSSPAPTLDFTDGKQEESAPDPGQKPGSDSNYAAPTGGRGWTEFVEQLTGRHARLGSMLLHSQASLKQAKTLQLAVADHTLNLLNNDALKTDILELWAEFNGSDKLERVELQSLSAVRKAAAGKDSAAPPDQNGARRLLPGKEEIFNDPTVRFISERFGGRITEISKNDD